MTTTSKRHRHHKNQISSTFISHDPSELTTDHDFIAPHEKYDNAIGLYSVLLNRQIIDMSFAKLYQQSLKIGWEKVFNQERQKLKPNDVSLLKCFVLNRLSYEYTKDSNAFIERINTLNDEIKSRMIREFPQWTAQDLFNRVRHWQDMQRRRRLFYFSHQEGAQLPSLLMLHKASSNWCYCLINHCQDNKNFSENEGRARLSEHLEHSFIVVAQPTGPDGAAVTQYTKNGFDHTARLNTRIICLLDPDILKEYIELSDIDVTLYPLNRENTDKKEEQPPITWEVKKVLSAEDVFVSVYCADFHTLQLEKFESDCKRLSLNSTLCQLEFRLKVKVKYPKFENTIVITTQPFGICSHGQYFPKFVSQIFLYEMKQILNNDNLVTDPTILAEFVRRYYTKMVGIEPTDHTNRYIAQVFATATEDVKSTRVTNTLDSMYEKILASIISQIDFMVLHPVLSLMYEDRLFLGICNSIEVDQMLHGTSSQPHLLLRFNTLTDHQWNSNPIVQFVVHDGSLKKASFDMKTFPNELCRFICESLSETAKPGLVLSNMSPRHFVDFQWYFDEEVYRLNKTTSPNIDIYEPLLPVLWTTMRQTHNEHDNETHFSSNNVIRKRKRSFSDSIRVIDSMLSETQSSTANAMIHMDSVSNSSTHSNSNKLNMIPLTIEYNNGCPSNSGETNRKNRQIIIDIPEDTDVSPVTIFRYLAEKLTNISGDQHSTIASNYLFCPLNKTLPSYPFKITNVNRSQHSISLLDHSINVSHSSSETFKVESRMLISETNADPLTPLKFKEEPQDVDNDIMNDQMTL